MLKHTYSLMNYVPHIKNIYGSEVSWHWTENNVTLGTSSSPNEQHSYGEINMDFKAQLSVGLHQITKRESHHKAQIFTDKMDSLRRNMLHRIYLITVSTYTL